jgi:Lambda phage tail tube protein, TTP
MLMAEVAHRGKNTKLFRESDTPGVFGEVTAIRELDPPGGERGEIDSTTLSSAATESIAGEPNFETVSFVQLKQGPTAMFLALNADFDDGSVRGWRIDYPDGTSAAFDGWVQRRKVRPAQFGAVLEIETTIKVTGTTTWS